MQPNRILPDLQCSLLCEEVRQEINGNFLLIGVIDAIRVPQVPVTAYKLTIFNRWTSGVGQFVETVRLVAPDQSTILRKSEIKFAMKDPLINATTVTLFGNVELATAGIYFLEISVDDVMKVRFPVHVVVVPPPNPNPTPPPPAAPAP